ASSGAVQEEVVMRVAGVVVVGYLMLLATWCYGEDYPRQWIVGTWQASAIGSPFHDGPEIRIFTAEGSLTFLAGVNTYRGQYSFDGKKLTYKLKSKEVRFVSGEVTTYPFHTFPFEETTVEVVSLSAAEMQLKDQIFNKVYGYKRSQPGPSPINLSDKAL